MNVLTWHVHGSYLQSLAAVPVRWVLPYGDGRPGYGGRSAGFPWPRNVIEVPVGELASCTFDAVVYQHLDHYQCDRAEVLTARQRTLPAIYVEHDPPGPRRRQFCTRSTMGGRSSSTSPTTTG